MDQLIEKMYTSDADVRLAFHTGSSEFDANVSELVSQFGVQPSESWKSVSSSQWNSIYEDDIVSVVNRTVPWYLDELEPSAVGRKFFLNKGWVYDKVYFITTETSCTLPSPTGTTPLFIGHLINVFGQPGDEDLSRYKCLYFKCDNHEAVETWAGEPLESGEYQTYYSATFDEDNGNERLRVKSYAYDNLGPFTDWDKIHEMMMSEMDDV